MKMFMKLFLNNLSFRNIRATHTNLTEAVSCINNVLTYILVTLNISKTDTKLLCMYFTGVFYRIFIKKKTLIK